MLLVLLISNLSDFTTAGFRLSDLDDNWYSATRPSFETSRYILPKLPNLAPPPPGEQSTSSFRSEIPYDRTVASTKHLRIRTNGPKTKWQAPVHSMRYVS